MGKFNKVKLITGTVDTTLSSDKLAPGIGEFSDRYFGTNWNILFKKYINEISYIHPNGNLMGFYIFSGVLG